MRKIHIFDKEDKLLYRILVNILKKYSYEVYRRGVSKAFDWNNNVDDVNDLSTMYKQNRNIIRINKT